MKIKEFLTELKWAQDAEALDLDGNTVNARDPEACSWCLTGAASYCYGVSSPEYIAAIEKLAETCIEFGGRNWGCPLTTIVEYNDDGSTDFGKIKSILEKADV